MQYNFKVVNDKMVCDKREMPLTGNVNTYGCVFDIECDIENLLWFCVFERDGKAYVQPILENECFIPREVLVSEGKIKIGCYATNLKEDDFKRISTNWVFFNSLEGAYSDATMPEVPEPDVWEELVLKSVPIIGENGNWFIYDITKMQYVDSGVKATGDKGYTPVKGVDYFTEEEKAEFTLEAKDYTDTAVDSVRVFAEDHYGVAMTEIDKAKSEAMAYTNESLRNDRKLKLLKTITLEEDVAELNVEFDKPVDEIAMLFNVAFLVAETKVMAARTDGGAWYMFWAGGAMKTTKQFFFVHTKEYAERRWETFASGAFFDGLQGISNSTTTPKLILSRRNDSLTRFIKDLHIFIPTNKNENAFVAGSTIQIWGHEADEDL